MKPSVGFTLIELVMVIVILGIVSVVAVPKFFDNSIFQARGFADQVLATLRYAQKSAIAQHRLVCVSLANATPATITLTIADLSTDTSCSTTKLKLPDRADADPNRNILTAQSNVTLSPTTTVNFNALGQASTPAEITISDVTAHIFVEAETGYVHQ